MQVNFNIKKTIFIPLITLIAIAFGFIGNALLPDTPTKMTIINRQQTLFTATCPALSEPLLTNNETALPATFSLLNWNIYKQQNKQWLTQLTKWTQQANLLTLQETKYSPAFRQFTQQQQLLPLQNIAFQYQQINYGVNTLSKTTPLQVCGTRYTEPWSRIPKSAVASTYQITGSKNPLLVVNLHGVNFTLTAAPLAEQLRPFITLIKAHKGPVIVAGDFNTWSEARTLTVDQALTELTLNEVTFNTDNRLKIFGRPLDHVFYRGLTVSNARSIPTNASDHTPQLITFKYKN